MNRQQLAYCFLLTILLFVANNQSVFGQGKLGRVRDAVRNSKPSKPKNDSREDRNRDNERSRNDDRRRDNDRQARNPRPQKRRQTNKRRRSPRCNSGLDIVIGPRLIAPVPRVQEVHVVHHTPQQIAPPVIEPVFVETAIVPEPVYQPVVSPIVEAPIPGADYFSESVSSFDWGVRMSAVGGTDFDDIAFGRFGMLLQVPGGPGIDTSVTMIRESGMSFRDHLFLGDVNIVYEPVIGDNFRMRVGLGVNWLGDSYGGDAGFNMTSGFDLRLTERTIATGEIDFGSIGDTDITHAQISLGRVINQNTEWIVGYDNLDIGGVTIGSAFTGLQFRF